MNDKKSDTDNEKSRPLPPKSAKPSPNGSGVEYDFGKRWTPDTINQILYGVEEDLDDPAFNLYQQALDAKTAEEAIRLAKAALRKNPKFLDATTFLLDFERESDEKQKKMEDLLAKEKKRLDADESTADIEGDYWGFLETRPYMRLANDYLKLLISLGKMRQAIAQAEYMLKLNTTDNLGVRNTLMSLYVLVEDKEAADALLAKYDDPMLGVQIPAMMLCYKLGDLAGAEAKLNDVLKYYPTFITGFFDAVRQISGYTNDIVAPDRYRPFSIEEIKVFFAESKFLLPTMQGFIYWLGEHDKSKKRKKK